MYYHCLIMDYHCLMGYLYDFFIHGLSFRALEYLSTHCASTPLSYIMHNMASHVQAKAFAGTRGGTMFHKTSLIPIYFIVKMIVSTQKLDHEAFEMDKKNIVVKYLIQPS